MATLSISLAGVLSTARLSTANASSRPLHCRWYTAEHAIALVKLRTLAEAGVPLARIKELLAAEPDRFAAAITEIDRNLVLSPRPAPRCALPAVRVNSPLPQARPDTVVSQSERMNENVKRAMAELAELRGVRPRLLADDTIELRPAPASPELSQKVAEIFERAGVRELRPWVWGVAKAHRMTLAARVKAVGRRLRASRSRVAAAVRRRT